MSTYTRGAALRQVHDAQCARRRNVYELRQAAAEEAAQRRAEAAEEPPQSTYARGAALRRAYDEQYAREGHELRKAAAEEAARLREKAAAARRRDETRGPPPERAPGKEPLKYQYPRGYGDAWEKMRGR